MKKRYYYMNMETGELLTLAEAVKQGTEEYDLFDDTNIMTFDDYYELTNTEIV